ncbi:cyclin-dependent kinase inhibitor 1B-like [Archocentrus centrarchus]|uniref:cyclin-dependent kinase inhibitor 1B-like n=1 Tax=Archocentrus centrarchus TaxID=63155 RepID=UPI0011E9E7E1|nr:cyclin-dependent kinase inhibitor 1B-like [Archocentrus centrarchus]
MSDVRLSNASPVERVDARQQDSVRPSVRRNLFGRPDPEEIRRDAEISVQEDVQRFRATYDFDPVEHRPLTPRSYAWVTDDDAPEFYRRQPHGRLSPQRRSDLPGDNNRQNNDSDERPSGRQPGRNGSRKRRAEPADSCSTECPTKRSRSSDGDDDDDKSAGAGSQTITAAEERPGRAEGSAELQ